MPGPRLDAQKADSATIRMCLHPHIVPTWPVPLGRSAAEPSKGRLTITERILVPRMFHAGNLQIGKVALTTPYTRRADRI